MVTHAGTHNHIVIGTAVQVLQMPQLMTILMPIRSQEALMVLGLPEDIAKVLANEDIDYPLLAERIAAVRI